MAVVTGLIFLNQKNKRRNITTAKTTTTSEITRTDYSAVARKTLDWIDKQRNDNGWYILERGCDFENKTCDTVLDNKDGNRGGLIATWARFNFYQQTKDQTDLEIVKNDIDKFYKKYRGGVSDSLWICKITYDMWNTDVLNESSKDKLKNICLGSTFSKLVLDNSGYKQEQEKLLSSSDKNSQSWQSWKGYNSVIRAMDNYFGITSDLISQYRWTNDDYKLKLAKKYFESDKKIIEEQGESVKPENDCLVGLSAIDLYEYGGKDESILNYAKEKFMTFSDENSDTKKYQIPICGLMIKRLYQISKNSVFLDGLEKNNKLLKNLSFDGDNSSIKLLGDNGFFVSYGGSIYTYKDVIENALMVELLRD
jgi:hypothetical protein